MDIELSDGMLNWVGHGILKDAEAHIRNEDCSSFTPEEMIKLRAGVFEAIDLLYCCRQDLWKEVKQKKEGQMIRIGKH